MGSKKQDVEDMKDLQSSSSGQQKSLKKSSAYGQSLLVYTLSYLHYSIHAHTACLFLIIIHTATDYHNIIDIMCWDLRMLHNDIVICMNT